MRKGWSADARATGPHSPSSNSPPSRPRNQSSRTSRLHQQCTRAGDVPEASQERLPFPGFISHDPANKMQLRESAGKELLPTRDGCLERHNCADDGFGCQTAARNGKTNGRKLSPIRKMHKCIFPTTARIIPPSSFF